MLAPEVGLLAPFAPNVALPDLEDGLLEPGLEREFGLLELALEVGRLPPSLPSENGEDELESKCCCRCGGRVFFTQFRRK